MKLCLRLLFCLMSAPVFSMHRVTYSVVNPVTAMAVRYCAGKDNAVQALPLKKLEADDSYFYFLGFVGMLYVLCVNHKQEQETQRRRQARLYREQAEKIKTRKLATAQSDTKA